jgi:hypothetical protein
MRTESSEHFITLSPFFTEMKHIAAVTKKKTWRKLERGDHFRPNAKVCNTPYLTTLFSGCCFGLPISVLIKP